MKRKLVLELDGLQAVRIRILIHRKINTNMCTIIK